jgi:ubiquinone/menaquinone biosynthesis C-methylase UbiE
VGFYSRVIFPRLCDVILNQPAIAKLRRELLAHAEGRILEIGFGTGLNLPCYPRAVRGITAVDPNPGMHRLASGRIHQTGIDVVHYQLRSEQLPFDAGAFDCVISTFTLCSIDDVDQALREVQRVLKPGGRLLLMEHGLSPDPGVQRWQRRLNWLEGLLADGCRLDRNVRELVRAFAPVYVDEFYLERTPRTHGYLYRGIVRR